MRRIALLAALIGSAAHAQDLRELCTDRPGLGTPPCVVDKGHLQIELGLGDWTLDKQPDSRTDTIVAGELVARLGVTPSTELRFGWNAYGHTRERDRMTGEISRMSGTGDVTLGILQNFASPDGDGFSISAIPQVTLPTGGKAIGAGTWGAGLLIPVSYDLSDTFQLSLTPELDAAPNESRHGRHLAYSGVIGLQTKLSEKSDLTTEFEAKRDRDPEQHATELLAAVSIDYKPTKRFQIDAQAVAGLNRNSPDVQLVFGISEKF